jgi:hypothetical protein
VVFNTPFIFFFFIFFFFFFLKKKKNIGLPLKKGVVEVLANFGCTA